MTEVVGILERTNTREGRFGPQVSYCVNGTWYTGGKYLQRDVKEGDTVKVTFTTNARGYHDLAKHGGLIKVESGSAQTERSGSGSTGGSAAAPKPAYVDNRQEVISKQAAMNTALQFLQLQVQLGGIKFPASAKAPDIFAGVNGMLLTEAARIYQLNTGNVWDLQDIEQDDALPSDEMVNEYND